MTHSEDDLFDDPTEVDELEELDEFHDLGEDHRGDNPGYDLDEQAAIEALEAEQRDED